MRVSITLLSYDHGILRQVLDVLEVMNKKSLLERHREDLPEMTNFFLGFMDKYHHGKEEQFVFPAMAPKSQELGAMVEDLIRDHRKAKALVDAMAAALDEGDLVSFGDSSIKLVEHMRAHIKEEEDQVFPLMEQQLDPDVDLDIYEKSARLMEENFGADFQKKNEEYSFRIQEVVMGPGVVSFEVI
jgi:hemerythrin-like domain-containing protein